MTTSSRDPLGTDRVPVAPGLSMFDPIFIGIDEFGQPVYLDVIYRKTGALFRAVRAAMGLEINFRTRNAVPIFCRPPAPGAPDWMLTDLQGAGSSGHAHGRRTVRTAAP